MDTKDINKPEKMAGQIVLKWCNDKLCISLIILVLCWSHNWGIVAQADFTDDSGADTTGSDATSDMMNNDPYLINPQKNQMWGLDSSTSISDITGRSIALHFEE